MSDPRYTDPRSEQRLSDPVGRRDDVGGPWGWIAGLVVIALIAFFLIAGGKGVNDNSASNVPPASTTGSAPMRNVTPGPSTTGMGAPSQYPAQPTTTPATGK